MTVIHSPYRLLIQCLASGLLWGGAAAAMPPIGAAQSQALTLAAGFAPNPTVLRGTGGGDRPAADIVNTRQTPTGPCLGYISATPHEEITLESRFFNLEMSVEAAADTTLIVEGPGGIWCNDDSRGKNPAIAGEWLPGRYRVWIGSYRIEDIPEYQLSIRAK